MLKKMFSKVNCCSAFQCEEQIVFVVYCRNHQLVSSKLTGAAVPQGVISPMDSKRCGWWGKRNAELKDQRLRIKILDGLESFISYCLKTSKNCSYHSYTQSLIIACWFIALVYSYEWFHPYFSFLSKDTIRSTGLCNQVMDLLQWMAPRWQQKSPWGRWAMVKLERGWIIGNLYSHNQIVHGFEKYPAFFVQFCFFFGGRQNIMQDLNGLNLLNDLSLRITFEFDGFVPQIWSMDDSRCVNPLIDVDCRLCLVKQY